ncbi:hypothetical protein [Aeromonas hydrophila]|uniref:hypothetical protein n=1 Tax=Aeromonas hydrophila TaxID=644 RepID=UPI002B47525E|nr:hypothetical protein [Aeromonas hydrophila]
MSKPPSITKWLEKSTSCPKCGQNIKARHVCIHCGRIGFSDNDFLSKIFNSPIGLSSLIINTASYKSKITNNEVMLLCSGIILKKISQEDTNTIIEANKFNKDKSIDWALNIAKIQSSTSITLEQLVDKKIIIEIEQHSTTAPEDPIYTECILRFIDSGMHKRASELAALKVRTTEEDNELIEITKSFTFGA